MINLKTLNIKSELLGLPVLDPDTARLHGRVTEAIVHPTTGILLGLLLETPGGETRAALGEDCYIFGDVAAIITPGCFVTTPAELANDLASGVAVNRELLGAQVVTEAGEWVGHLTEAHLHEERLQVFYRIARSCPQELPDEDFFISGSLPLSWLQERSQLVVPAEAGQQAGENCAPCSTDQPAVSDAFPRLRRTA